jgi:hypothetical protein
MILFVSAWLVFVFSSSSFAQPPSLKNSLKNVVEQCKQQEMYAEGNNSKFMDWQNWLSTLKVSDSFDFYRQLIGSDNFRDFSGRSMRMAYSRSAQSAAVNPDHPRLITYHPMGVILGIVDTPVPQLQFMNREFEGIRYDFVKDEWQPFKGHIKSDRTELSFAPTQTTSCTSCHGTPFRPIWRTYRAWAGQMSAFPPKKDDRLGEIALSSDSEPGQILTMYLNRFNYRRMHARLRENSNWSMFMPAAVAALAGCSNIPDFIGPPNSPLRKQLAAGNPNRFEVLKNEVSNHISKLYETERVYARTLGDSQALQDMNQENEMEDAERMASLRYLFETTGTDVKSFSMSRQPGKFGYGFNQVGTASGGVHNLLCNILPEYVERGGKSKAVLTWQPYSVFYGDRLDEVCAELKSESLRRTRNGTN